ncbi:MAG: PrsW family glutamic-type intramembrane protease [Alkalispirochaeta sp.]
MTLGRVVINILLIATVPIIVLIRYHSQRGTVQRGVVAGAISATLVVTGLLTLRRAPVLSADAMSVVVVMAEEAVKFGAVYALLRFRTHPGSRSTSPGATDNATPASTAPATAAATGWSVGAGFATAEHLLYATAAPRIVLLRILTAGIIHTVTARSYSAVLTSRTTPSDGLRVAATLIAGALLHLGYNLLAQRLDQIPALW